MNKKQFPKIIVSLLASLLLFSCHVPPSETDSQHNLLNGFEKREDLSRLKMLNTYFSGAKARLEIQESKVKEGIGALSLHVESGLNPSLIMPFSESLNPSINKVDIHDLSLSIYNDQNIAVEAYLNLYVAGLKTLLTETVSLAPKEWNEAVFRLSKLALQYNADSILGMTVTFQTSGEAIFYLDEWKANMGASATEKDVANQSILNQIIERINALPPAISINESHEKELSSIYSLYEKLNEMYRPIVPNFELYKEALAQYATVTAASLGNDAVESILPLDSYYGMGLIGHAYGGDATMFYQKDIRFADEEGSLKTTYSGTEVNYFTYKIPSPLNNYRYVEMSFYNDDPIKHQTKRVWFNWEQYVDVRDGEWGTIRIKTDEIGQEGRLIVVQIDKSGSVASSGHLYMSAMRGYSHIGQLSLLNELIDKLPNPSTLTDEAAITKNLFDIQEACNIYESLPDNLLTQVSNERKLKDILAVTSSYRIVYGVDEMPFSGLDYKWRGSISRFADPTYGKVFGWKIDSLEPDSADQSKIQIEFGGIKNGSQYRDLFFSVYNPTSKLVHLDFYPGNWHNNVSVDLAPQAWTTVKTAGSNYEKGRNFFFLPAEDAMATGWKFTMVYGFSISSLIQPLIQDIARLPQDSSLTDLKSIIAALPLIWEAKRTYEALDDSLKTQVVNSDKLKALLETTKSYEIAYGLTKSPSPGLDYKWIGSVTMEDDETYGRVFNISIDSIKDDSADPNFVEIGFGGVDNGDNYSEIFFYVYNPTEVAVSGTFYPGNWHNPANVLFAPKGWTRIALPGSQYEVGRNFIVLPSSVAGSLWKTTMFYGKTQASTINSLNQAIDSLPESETVATETDIMRVLPIASSLQKQYLSLSFSLQPKVNIAKLNAILAKCQGYSILFGTDKKPGFGLDYACSGTVDKIADETYGEVFSLDVQAISNSEALIQIEILGAKNDADKAFFYLFNPHETEVSFYWHPNSWNGGESLVSCSGKSWTRFECDCSLLSTNRAFIYCNASFVSSDWKMTMVYGKVS